MWPGFSRFLVVASVCERCPCAGKLISFSRYIRVNFINKIKVLSSSGYSWVYHGSRRELSFSSPRVANRPLEDKKWRRNVSTAN
ncbi:hypothetical protein PUN4_1450005 [Paraburkholderia unamae]|nr:hypothetical protein PUN4_1450005 [Paraburkholderia unamae]